jgi:ribonuclease H
MKIVFTDGSASPNPGPGGFAVIDAETGEPVILGRSSLTTNIIMEGEAIFVAMSEFAGVEIHTDSEFWINVLTKWAPSWVKNGWKKKSGPIKNLELVKRLYEAYTDGNKKVKLVWVRGHVGTELNEKADEWANKAREKQTFLDLKVREIPPKEDE